MINSKNIMKELLSKIKEFDSEGELATDEYYDLIDISNDPYINQIILEGKFFSLRDAVLCDKTIGQCHKSVSEIMLNESEEGDILYTGFAKNPMNNEWFTHSFIVNNGRIVESGSILFAGYLGIPLYGIEKDNFIDYWINT
jgi:hypothetical protein